MRRAVLVLAFGFSVVSCGGGGSKGAAPSDEAGNGGEGGSGGSVAGKGGSSPSGGSGGAGSPDAATSDATSSGPPDGPGASVDTGPGAAPEGGAPSTGPGAWRTGTPLPVAREEHAVAVVDGVMFVVGGGVGTANRVEAFDPKTNGWTTHANLPTGLDHASVAGVGGKLYVLGGTQTGNCWEYDPAARKWTPKAPMPVQRAATATGVIGTLVYVAGGQGGGATAATDFQAYDTATDKWLASSRNELPPLPAGRNHVQGAVVNGLFYIMGGRLGPAGTGLSDRLDAFDPVTKKWSAKASLPHKRGAGAAGVVNDLIVFAVGEGNEADPTGLYKIAEAYDPKLDAWRALAPLAMARHGLGAASIDGKIYVVGGATGAGGGKPTSIIEEFTP
jgi:hypothetical protein